MYFQMDRLSLGSDSSIKKRKPKTQHPCLYFLSSCNRWIVRMTELSESPVKFSSRVKCWQSQYRHFRVINFRSLITLAASRSLNSPRRQCHIKYWYNRHSSEISDIFSHILISKHNAFAQTMVGIKLPEKKKLWITVKCWFIIANLLWQCYLRTSGRAGILTHQQLQWLHMLMSWNLSVRLRQGSKFSQSSGLKDTQSCI